MACELCDRPGGALLWQDGFCRVVLAEEPGYSALCRVVLNTHVSEMTDLAYDERARLMEVVFAVEAVLREALRPRKINLASLGNMTPHLHWHVIPRFPDDPHFPQPIWGAAQRAGSPHPVEKLAERLATALAAMLSEGAPPDGPGRRM